MLILSAETINKMSKEELREAYMHLQALASEMHTFIHCQKELIETYKMLHNDINHVAEMEFYLGQVNTRFDAMAESIDVKYGIKDKSEEF